MGFHTTQPATSDATSARPLCPTRPPQLNSRKPHRGPTSNRILSSKYCDRESHLYCFGFRYYASHTARWAQRDPAGRVGGANLYSAGRNQLINAVDVLGLWSSLGWPPYGDHGSLTMMSFLNAPPSRWPTRLCRDRILNRLLRANVSQDASLSLLENQRHYNREVGESRRSTDIEYLLQLRTELGVFNAKLRRPSNANCRDALDALGRLSHSWQDFYMHAIRSDGLGGRESSRVPGWTAWTDTPPVTGDPDDRANFYPSSHAWGGGGEHPCLA
jgi:RHS repeat-associated protein